MLQDQDLDRRISVWRPRPRRSRGLQGCQVHQLDDGSSSVHAVAQVVRFRGSGVRQRRRTMRRCQSALRRAVAVLTGTLHRPRTAVLYANRSLNAFNNNNNIIIIYCSHRSL